VPYEYPLCIRDADGLAGEQIDASMFVPVDIGVEITKIKKERRTFTILHEGQSAILNQAPELPFADAEIVGSLPRPEEATVMMRW
jgi:hypothetical protein